MNKKIAFKSIFLLTAMMSIPALGDVMQDRCRELADKSISLVSYDANQTGKIRAWLMACYKDKYALELEENQYLIDVQAGHILNRPMFPVFAKQDIVHDPSSLTGIRLIESNPRHYQFPIAAIMANPATAPCDVPADYKLVSWCGSGCYTPDQSLFFPSGWSKIGDAQNEKLNEIVTLSESSTRDHLQFQSTPIRQFVTDPEPRKQDILRFQMQSGNELKVTTNHPLVDDNGKIRRADSMTVGESLIESNGQLDPIVTIQPIKYFGKVINVDVNSHLPQNNIVVAQGYLNGAYAFQNEGIAWLNRTLLRTSLIPKEDLR